MGNYKKIDKDDIFIYKKHNSDDERPQVKISTKSTATMS